MTIKRRVQSHEVVISNDVNTTTAVVEFHDDADIGILLGSGWTASNVTVYAWSDVDNAWFVVRDASGNDCIIATIPSKAYQLPSMLFPFKKLALVSDNGLNNAVNVEIQVKG